MAEELISEPPDRIPLPPSVAGSEYSGEADRIPLPPSVASSEYGEDAEPLQMEALSLRMMNGDVREQPPLEAPPVEDTESKPTSDDSWDRPQEPEQDSIPRAEHTTVQEETRMEATSPELPIPFLDLVSIIRRDAYEQVRYQALQSNVSRLLYDCGINGRYIPIQSHLYRRMVECFRSDKKTAFASLYTQSVNIGRSRDPNAHILVPELASGIAQSTQEGSATQLSWIQMLPPGSERNVMKFLTSIRTDPCFLADRIARLSSAQLNSLARPYRQSSTPDSVLHPSSIYGKFDPRNFHRNLSRTSDPLPSPEDLLRDPILLLLHGLFDSSAQWGSPERQRQLDAWSSVCARIIEDGKPGSDDFCLTILDAFADFSPWTITPELEIFLLDLVRSGDFIVGSQGNQAVNFSQDNELHNARIAVATSEFFDNALSTLVGLLTRTSVRHGVPRASLDLARTTLEKVQNPEKKVKARSFFISRWFCTSFLSNALIWPEVKLMLSPSTYKH